MRIHSYCLGERAGHGCTEVMGPLDIWTKCDLHQPSPNVYTKQRQRRLELSRRIGTGPCCSARCGHASAQFCLAHGALPASIRLFVEAYPAALHLTLFDLTNALPHNTIGFCCGATGKKCHCTVNMCYSYLFRSAQRYSRYSFDNSSASARQDTNIPTLALGARLQCCNRNTPDGSWPSASREASTPNLLFLFISCLFACCLCCSIFCMA